MIFVAATREQPQQQTPVSGGDGDAPSPLPPPPKSPRPEPTAPRAFLKPLNAAQVQFVSFVGLKYVFQSHGPAHFWLMKNIYSNEQHVNNLSSRLSKKHHSQVLVRWRLPPEANVEICQFPEGARHPEINQEGISWNLT